MTTTTTNKASWEVKIRVSHGVTKSILVEAEHEGDAISKLLDAGYARESISGCREAGTKSYF